MGIGGSAISNWAESLDDISMLLFTWHRYGKAGRRKGSKGLNYGELRWVMTQKQDPMASRVIRHISSTFQSSSTVGVPRDYIS